MSCTKDMVSLRLAEIAMRVEKRFEKAIVGRIDSEQLVYQFGVVDMLDQLDKDMNRQKSDA